MNRFVAGTLAGLAATVPMTLSMKLMHEQLPAEEQYPLPPRLITEEMAEIAGVDEKLDEPEMKGLTILSHFAYGAACGAIYGPLTKKLPAGGVLGGVAFGLAVWTGSYLGWLPAAGILTPATEHPGRRNALMIAAHVVWGATAGVLVEQLVSGDGGKGGAHTPADAQDTGALLSG
ncbi:MAG TPA: DUF6789 family protein [Pyrinomonadaceae bacterium]|nr:DUF6789 family protein [Pyrinomonadaceae bacterium]